jgi:hypothetical protein
MRDGALAFKAEFSQARSDLVDKVSTCVKILRSTCARRMRAIKEEMKF